MDQLFLDVIGKPSLNHPRIISIIAENFSFLEDQARFLKATLAIPRVKKLPISDDRIVLVQIGPLPNDIRDQLRKEGWTIKQYLNIEQNDICDQIVQDLREINQRSLIYINDLSRIELACQHRNKQVRKILALADEFTRTKGHFTVFLYQNSQPPANSKILRDLEFLSEAQVRVKTCKAGYFKKIWWQTIPANKTLLCPRTETVYSTCKVGQFYWSSDLLCFHDKKRVPKNYNLDEDIYVEPESSTDDDKEESPDKIASKVSAEVHIESDDDDETELRPYLSARDPEKSRIFYYPDKDDDFDEDDPDSDLNI